MSKAIIHFDPERGVLTIEGDTSELRRDGTNMTQGRIIVGDADVWEEVTRQFGVAADLGPVRVTIERLRTIR